MRQELAGGWDSRTHLVDGRWIEREPLRPEVEPGLRTETTLLRWLAPELPLQVPVPFVVAEAPLRVRHRVVRGESVTRHDEVMGRRLGQFLVALHAKDVDTAVDLGVPSAARTWAKLVPLLDRFRHEVLPRLPAALAAPAHDLLVRIGDTPADTLVHGDLGPQHLLVHAGRLHAVIDWTDVHIGDPALDLSWALHGAGAAFAAGVEAAYRPDAALVRRARDWHLLGPWHEVLYGIDTGQDGFVRSGLTGTVARLSG